MLPNSLSLELYNPVIGFATTYTLAEEPERGDEKNNVLISVIREGGSSGVVAVDWIASLNGELI